VYVESVADRGQQSVKARVCFPSAVLSAARRHPPARAWAPGGLHAAALTIGAARARAEEYKRIRELIVGNGKRPGMMKAMGKGGGGRAGGMNPHNMQMNVAQMSRMLPPDVLKKMGGAGALQGLLKQMEGSGMKM